MALESVLDETPSAGGGGLVIWLDYATLLETGEWFVDYNTDVHNLDTDQTDALDYLFKTKKGWEGTGADQYQALYDVFLEEIYRPFFENKLLSIKNTTMDAITGACKLMNLCDDFHLAFDSDDYQAEIRFGRHGGGQLMYDSTYKNTIITYCEDVSTATDEEDELLEEAIAAVSDLHYPQFAIGINIVKGRKEFFIKKQKRIDNYKETFTDYTERVVQFDQDVADAYNAEVNENVKAAYDYVPLKEVEPWEVDCANQWVATGDFQSMIDFIRSSPKDARTWTDGRAEAITIIYINAYEGKNVDVLNTFYDQFCITFFQKSYKKWETVWIETEGINEATEQEITYDDYIVKVDPAVVDRMDDYMDKYAYPEAWTALTQEYHVSVGYTDEDRSDRVTCISVSQGEGGKLVTEVSIKNANGDTLSSVAVAEHNVFDDTYGNGVVPALRDAGLNEEQIDAYLEGEDGLRLKAHNPYYQMTDYEEKKAEELVEKHWEEHPEEKEYIKYASSYMDHGRNSGMTFDEWYTYWTGNEFDQETFEQAKYYYEIEHKTSEWDALWDGFTKTGYNIEKVVDKVGDNCADKINDALHLDDLFVPDEHDLKMKEFNEEMEQMREWERTASQTQNPGWYTAGHIVERFTTTAIASAAFGGAEVAGAVAEKVGGGILTEYAVTVACDTVVDTVVDTIPEMINNTCDGMDKEEVWDRAKDNFLGNIGINALTAGAGTAFKMAGEAGDGLKTAENGADAIKAVDNASDTAKAIAGNADTLKAVGNAADSAKAVGNSMDSVKAAANSTDVAKAAANSSDITKAASNASDTAKSVAKSSDTVKTVANSADTAKATSNAVDTTKAAANSADTAKAASNSIDTAKTAEHVAESTKAADTIKTADNVADVPYVVNTADHVTDSVKEAAHTSDVSKITAKAADADDAVEISIEKSKTIGDQDCIVKNADPTADPNIHVEKNVSVVPNRTANLDGNSAYNGGNYSGLRDLMTPEEIARYDEYWLDVAEQISNEALDDQILFIKNGGITKPGGGAYKPVKISATVDLNTGEIYIGYNGANKFNPSRMEIHPSLQERINKTMYLAENTSGNPYASRRSFQLWSVDNCAEIYSSNLALHNGASLDNILINTKEFKSGEWAPPCENCKVTFEGVYFPKRGQ